jgi:hypothetical protein
VPARARTRLCELLRREDAERETAVDELVRQRLRGALATGENLVRKPEFLGVAHPLLDRRERPAVKEIWRVDGVAARPQLVREGVEASGLTLRVVEQQHVGHLSSLYDRE